MKRSPIFDVQVLQGAQMSSFAGWEVPAHFSSVRQENAAVRAQVGLFDVSFLGRIEVTGKEAARRLERVLMLTVGANFPGKCEYGLMCNEAGGILDDLTCFHLEEDKFLLVTNASQTAADLRWVRHYVEGAGVTVRDRTAEEFAFALQGPLAQAALQELTSDDLSKLRHRRWISTSVADYPLMLSRTGYTGADGFELFGNAADAEKIWDILLEKGKENDIQPCGYMARDLCRLEAANRMIGVDMDAAISPLEAGLEWAVHHDNELAMGRGALIAERIRHSQGAKAQRLHGFIVEGKDVPSCGMNILLKNRKVGEVTSGNFSYILGRPFGLGYIIGIEPLSSGTEIEIDAAGNVLSARIVNLPFIKRGDAS